MNTTFGLIDSTESIIIDIIESIVLTLEKPLLKLHSEWNQVMLRKFLDKFRDEIICVSFFFYRLRPTPQLSLESAS